MVLKTAWDEEFHRPVVFYFNKAVAAGAGIDREGLLLDLHHPAVHYSSVEDVIKWINS